MAPTSVSRKSKHATCRVHSDEIEVSFGRNKSSLSQGKALKEEATKRHGLRKMIGRGVRAAIRAIDNGVGLGGLGNVIVEGLAGTAGALIGGGRKKRLTAKDYNAEVYVKYKKGEGAYLSFDLSSSKYSDGKETGSKVRFFSSPPFVSSIATVTGTPEQSHLKNFFDRTRPPTPGYRLLQVPNDAGAADANGNECTTWFSPSRLDDLEMRRGDGTATRNSTRSSLLAQFDPLNLPNVSEAASPEFAAVPLLGRDNNPTEPQIPRGGSVAEVVGNIADVKSENLTPAPATRKSKSGIPVLKSETNKNRASHKNKTSMNNRILTPPFFIKPKNIKQEQPSE